MEASHPEADQLTYLQSNLEALPDYRLREGFEVPGLRGLGPPAASLPGRRSRPSSLRRPPGRDRIPYRRVGPPLLAYVNSRRHAHPAPISRVVLPELVADYWRASWLHNHRAVWLISRVTVAVADVTYHLHSRRRGRSGRVAQSWS